MHSRTKRNEAYKLRTAHYCIHVPHVLRTFVYSPLLVHTMIVMSFYQSDGWALNFKL